MKGRFFQNIPFTPRSRTEGPLSTLERLRKVPRSSGGPEVLVSAPVQTAYTRSSVLDSTPGTPSGASRPDLCRNKADDWTLRVRVAGDERGF